MLSENAPLTGSDQVQLSDPIDILMGSDSAVLTEIALAIHTRVRSLSLSKAMHLLSVNGEISEIRSSLMDAIQTTNGILGPHYLDNCIRGAAANPVYNGTAQDLLAKGAMPYRIAEHHRATAVVIGNRPKEST